MQAVINRLNAIRALKRVIILNIFCTSYQGLYFESYSLIFKLIDLINIIAA